jgi:hypothetical protein
MGYLKELIAVCATIITALKLWLEGDGQTLIALFTLYGALFGWDAKTALEKKEE